MHKTILIAHNIRSCHNIGALFRTADGLGVDEFVISGYSPYPQQENDERMPHIAERVSRSIHKTALGAEKSLKWHKVNELKPYLNKLTKRGFSIYALEQAAGSIPIQEFLPPKKIALIVGNEITGIDATLLEGLDGVIEIPMLGSKESLNVSCAASIGLYHCTYRKTGAN